MKNKLSNIKNERPAVSKKRGRPAKKSSPDDSSILKKDCPIDSPDLVQNYGAVIKSDNNTISYINRDKPCSNLNPNIKRFSGDTEQLEDKAAKIKKNKTKQNEKFAEKFEKRRPKSIYIPNPSENNWDD